MAPARIPATGQLVLLLAMFVGVAVTVHQGDHVGQAIIWLPSGIGVAGVALLGWRALWAVPAAAIMARLWLGQDLAVGWIASLGSLCEAGLGAAILRPVVARGRADRVRDIGVLYLAAAAAPLGSLLFSAVTRSVLPTDMAITEGWLGWWRMNAIGILLVVPLALAWHRLRRERSVWRSLGGAAGMAVFALALVAAVMLLADGVAAIVLLGGSLLVSLFAAVRVGAHGATTAATVATLAIAVPTGHGFGPFLELPYEQRHVVAQLLLVGLAALPILFSAMLSERDNSAERWLASEGLGEALLRILPDATYRISDDGRIVDAVLPGSPPDPTQLPVEALVGRHLHEVVAQPVCERMLEQLARARAGQPTEVVEYARSSPAGERDREVRFLRLPGGDTIAVARDITDRKRAQRQVALQAEILEMIATARRRSEIFDALVAGVETQIPGSLCSILIAQGDRLRLGAAPSLPDDYNAAVDGLRIGPGVGCCGTAAYHNEVIVCPDVHDSPLWEPYRAIVDEHGLRACWSVPIRSAKGSVLGTFAIYHREVTHPERHELALVERAAVLAGFALDRERREGLLASIQQNVSEGLYRSIPGQGFAYVNDSFARLFGYESADDLRSNWRDADNAEHRDSLERLATETLTARHRELRLHRRDGTTFWALVSTSVHFHDDDAELICDGTLTDVTEHRQLEEQLRQAQKMEAVGQLAGGVAHDFNNLMTAITGFAESVRGELPETSPLRQDVEQILIAGNRATTLTRQLLAFGRRQVLAPQVLELPRVAEEIGDMARRLIGEHIELAFERPRESVRAKVDRGQLEQVILNLVINARDAMPTGGHIRVSTATLDVESADELPDAELPAGRYATLRVADDGCGMPDDVRARAFDPFFTTKGPGRGTGLGLSTVYGIVKQSGGAVAIESEQGRGTTITVYLPFADELPREDRPVVLPRPRGRAGTILIAEDEPFVRELAERALRHAGHDVLTAADGSDALATFTEHADRIDAIVSDMMMPQMSGKELARRLAALRPDVRILFISGFAEDAEGLTGPNTHFLHKPFTATELIEGVDDLLGGTSRSRGTPTTT